MAVHSISVKELISRVRLVFPDAPEAYVINLINEALIDMGMHQQKVENAKTNLIDNKLWYDLDDDESITVNKIHSCYIKNSDGEYIIISRLTPGRIKQFYNETSISDVFGWTEV